MFARKHNQPIDTLTFHVTVLPFYRNHVISSELNNGTTDIDAIGAMPLSEDGVFLHGLFMVNFRWNDDKQYVDDALASNIVNPLPMLHIAPVTDFEPPESLYAAPLYKTSLRTGDNAFTGFANNGIYCQYCLLNYDLKGSVQEPLYALLYCICSPYDFRSHHNDFNILTTYYIYHFLSMLNFQIQHIT